MYWFWAALAGIVIYLDTTAVAQLMISQPFIACTLWGWIAGRPDIGLFLGIAFQLLWMGTLPVGASRFPEGNVGAFVATVLIVHAAGTGHVIPVLQSLLAFMIAIATAYAGAEVTVFVRRTMIPVSLRAVQAAESGNGARFYSLFAGAIGIHAVAGLVLTTGGLAAGALLLSISRHWINLDSFSHHWPALFGVGAAVIVSRFVKRTNLGWFLAATAVAFGGTLLWH